MITTKLHITTLTRRTVTRARGRMAYDELRPRLQGNESLEIDLAGEYPLSLSFLDEFIRHLSDARCLDRITFVVKGGDALRKLGRVSHIRRVAIWYRDTDILQRKTVEPLPETMTESVFVDTKPEDETR